MLLVEGAGGSEVDKVEGRLMAGPHDTIRSAATIERSSSSNYLAGISIIVRFPP